MRSLRNLQDYVELFWLVTAFGALGGLASELVAQARGRPGDVRLLRWDRGGGVLNIGVFGSVIVGTVAALASLVFFPFTEVIEEGVRSERYELVRVVSLSIAAGVAGSAVLGAVAARAAATVQADRARRAEATGREEVDRILADLPGLVQAAVAQSLRPELEQRARQQADDLAQAWQEQLQQMGAEGVQPTPPRAAADGALDELVDAVAGEVSAAVAPAVRERGESAKRAISAAAGTASG